MSTIVPGERDPGALVKNGEKSNNVDKYLVSADILLDILR